MTEARRLLGEAFLAVELAESVPGGASSQEAREKHARRSVEKSASAFDAQSPDVLFDERRSR